MSRTAMLIAAGATACLLFAAACAEDAPTASSGTLQSAQTSSLQGASLPPGVRSTITPTVATEIAACVNNSSGEMKIVSAGTVCGHNEYLLTWPTASGGGSGITGYEIVAHQEWLAPGYWNVHVECSTGKKVLGGGFSIETPNDVKLFTSEPSDGNGNLINHGWNVFVQNAGSVIRQTSVYAICASAQ